MAYNGIEAQRAFGEYCGRESRLNGFCGVPFDADAAFR